jgi:hypothetical protein
VEQKLLDGMSELKRDRLSALESMNQHGSKAKVLFDSFVNLWLDPVEMSLENFDLRPLTKGLRCPALVLHSPHDPFSSFHAQVEPIAINAKTPVKVEFLNRSVPGRVPFLELQSQGRKKKKQVVSPHVVTLVSDLYNSLF